MSKINELKAENASLTNCNSTLSDEVRNRKDKVVDDAVKEGASDACEAPVYAQAVRRNRRGQYDLGI